MTSDQPTRDRNESDDRIDAVDRRTFIAAGSSVSAAILAGCTSDVSPSDDDTETTTNDADASGGNFRLLISDMPADIGDFERLDVTFDRARIFDGGNEESDEGESDEEQADSEETETEKSDDEEQTDDEEQMDEEDGGDDPDNGGDDEETAQSEEEDEDDEENGGGVERKRGFYVLDLDGATVDLTQVVGDKAMSVFEGELSEGTYEKIELHVSDVEGIVDGEAVEVNVPSEKLQITTPFEIGGDDPVEFVFDINVVKRGPDNGYNLKPVISKSGVNGEDVDVEDVDEDEDENDNENDESEDEKDESDDEDEDDGDGEEGTNDGEDDTEDGTGENGDAGEAGN